MGLIFERGVVFMPIYAIIWFVVVISIIYIFIAKFIFTFCAKIDLFEETNCRINNKFPTITFFVSMFWIIAVPILLVFYLFLAIIEWISIETTTSYQAILEVENQKRKDK